MQEVNKMKPYNLAVVFGPSLMRSPDDQIDGLHNPLKIKIVETFIIHYDEIFGTISRKGGIFFFLFFSSFLFISFILYYLNFIK